jgi:uncharacterized protein YndB with AHSA1/START domain
MKEKIIVETVVQAPVSQVWQCWTNPEHITKWCFASDDWCAPMATNDVRVGGVFTTRMEAKDKSAGFDFGGTYTVVEEEKRLDYVMNGEDERKVSILFTVEGEGCRVTETFEAESENPLEMQRAGWQSILENFRQYVESV